MDNAKAIVKSVLAEAEEIVNGARRQDYGTPLANHTRTAALWSAYLGVPITPRQVCILNVLQKASRDAHAPKRDNLVDIAGWAENADQCDARRDSKYDDYCGADSPGNEWSCQRSHIHDGDHAATTPTGLVTWPNYTYDGINGVDGDGRVEIRL